MVIEMAPGWIYVKIAEPKPEPARIELLLGLTIEQWFNAHPQFVIDKTESLTEHGTLQGINVWYHVDDRQPVPVNPEPPQQVSSLAIELHDQIRQQLPMEHIEAVVDEAIQIWRSHQDGYGTMCRHHASSNRRHSRQAGKSWGHGPCRFHLSKD